MNRRQKLVKGSCTNCGLSDHDAKHYFERPRKVPARFLHNNQVQEPIVREVAAPKDEWDKYLLKKQEEKELRRSTGGGVRSFRCREDIPEYLRKPAKANAKANAKAKAKAKDVDVDEDEDEDEDFEDFGDLTAHYDPRVRFNYRKKISAGKENFELVDYARTPEEVQQHFQSWGTVNRVTILTDKFGQPEDAVQNAPGRQLKVSSKWYKCS